MAIKERHLLDDQPSLARFLHVYKIITERVAYQAEHTDRFDNAERMETIDLAFANLYFQALKSYRNNESTTPWTTYFDACKTHDQPIIHVLLGINAHVNGDLAIAIRTTNYTEYDDYTAVNSVLKEATPTILHYLADNGDIYGELSEVLTTTFVDQAIALLTQWREDVWTVAHSDISKEHIHEACESLAADLLRALQDNPLRHPIRIQDTIEEAVLSDYL